MPSRAAFIDRDGVLNRDHGHVHRIEDFEWLPGAIDGLRRLQADGWQLVVVTNQAGISRGLYPAAQYHQLTGHMLRNLAAAGVHLAGVYHCPHHPTAGQHAVACDCRKPAPGMLVRAAADLGLDLAVSVLIGDKRSDIDAGRAAGVARCILVGSGHPTSLADRSAADHFCADLMAAALHLTGPGRPPTTAHEAHEDEVFDSHR